jgi:hypothetical protein
VNMNEDERIIEELSAHIDGLAEDPVALDEAMRRDPDLARRYEQMLAISRRLNALPAPDVHPAFVTRVMAHVAETQPARRAPWWRWAAVGCAATLIAFVAGISAWRPGEPVQIAAPALDKTNNSQAPGTPDIFDSAILNMADAGDIAEIDAPAIDDAPSADPAEQAVVFAAFERAVEADLDIDAELMSLTDEEIGQLHQLLQRQGSDRSSWS